MKQAPARASSLPQAMRRWAALAAFFGVVGPGCDSPDPGLCSSPSDAGRASDAASDASSDASSDTSRAEQPYAIAVLPDTQYYASSFPDVFMAQTRWLVENRDAQHIAFVLHTGDIVDSDEPLQWERASRSLHLLDDQVPYVITAGNHDYKNLADRMGMGNIYFPASRFAQSPWFGGTFEPDHIENSFSLFDVGATRWVVIALEFGPRDEVVTWADSVLRLFRDRPAIIVTHAYLYHDGTRYDFKRAIHQNFNPHDYVMMGQPGTTVNDGEELWQKLIARNSNVKLVFSGHDVNGSGLPPGTSALLTSTRADGTRVYQMLANYQTCLNPPCDTFSDGTTTQTVRGGNGFLRILRFSPDARKIQVSTYSPYLDVSLTDPGNAFSLDLN